MSVESERNPGIALDLGWVAKSRVNLSGVERRTATLGTRRSVKKAWQAAWLLKAISCIDLTTLAGDDTPGKVRRLCAKARQPLRPDLVEALGVGHLKITTGAVCVYPSRVAEAVAALEGANIPVAAVATGFPAGQTPLPQRLAEIEAAVKAGAREIDIVINRNAALNERWDIVYDEVKQMRAACGEAHMKAILATGELATMRRVHKASLVCMMAGSDFIKTSTGKEKVNATLEVSLVMVRALREYTTATGHMVGFKPAGGIGTAKQALQWLMLMKEELGDEWLTPDWFRFGASSLLGDIERQLSHHVTGNYAARHHMPMS
ncbi:MAG TPA: deoxyribose-phosphate aldolase [Anaerolineae bacterium]|nr:deoxyribose-phosphate aldolase [Anaerolineae bacterium]